MNKALIILLVCFLIVSCQRNERLVYSNYQETESQWHKDSVKRFSFTPQDTLVGYNLIVYLRNDQTYPFTNLHLITKMEFPSGQIISDTLEYEMAHPDGRLLGQGNNLKESRLLFKENVKFFEAGEYHFSIQHLMRKAEDVNGLELLDGVYNIGLEIERNSQK